MRTAALLGCLTTAGATVMSVDLGSEFIKVAAVKPGTGIDIVLNEQSKRKSNNYIGYRGDDRFLGEDAFNLAPRFPDRMYTFLNRVIGKPWADESARALLTDEWALPYEFVENSKRGTIDLKNPDPAVTYTMEELLAQVLSYAKTQADIAMETSVTEAVIAIPSFWDFRQRQALVDAANMTGLNIHGLIHHTTAAALQYGVQKRGFGNQTLNLVVYDMGASKLEVGVYRFRPYDKSDPKVKAKDVLGAMDVLAITSDESLGGRTVDVRIARYLAKKFQEATKLDLLADNSITAKKAFTSLLRHSNKAKEVLSANKQAPVQIEELYGGKPFFYKLTRDELESECKDLFERSVPTVQRALKRAGVEMSDINAFEIIGGGVRIPLLQTALSEAIGRGLDRTLNGDECVTLGAAFQAAKLSGSFRTKGFVITEVSSQTPNISFQLSQIEGSDKVPKVRPLFTNPKSGVKKSITVARTADFDIKIFTTEGAEDDAKHTPLQTMRIGSVAKILDDVGFNKADKSPNSTHSVAVQIKLTDEGLLRAALTEVKYDEHVTVQRRVRVKEPKVNATANATANATDDDKAEEKKEEEKADEAKSGDDAEKSDEKKETEKEEKKKEEKKYILVNKTEVRKHRKAVVPKIIYETPLPMDEDDYAASKETLQKLQAIEDRKKEAAAAKNALETYLYWVRYEGILDNDAMKEFVTEEDESRVKDALAKCDEWMEDGAGSEDSTEAKEFVEQRKLVEEAVKPITDKKKEKEEAARKAQEEELKKKREEEEAERKAAEEAKKAESGTEDESGAGSDSGDKDDGAGSEKKSEGERKPDEL